MLTGSLIGHPSLWRIMALVSDSAMLVEPPGRHGAGMFPRCPRWDPFHGLASLQVARREERGPAAAETRAHGLLQSTSVCRGGPVCLDDQLLNGVRAGDHREMAGFHFSDLGSRVLGHRALEGGGNDVILGSQ